ncbi:hypothetical protein L6R46_13630 [Myxococcota bacterium]|jgi:hypothetical protein|nr:hypothetical protein [Myxococcota bacterium]
MDLHLLWAGVDHLLPNEETDVLPCYELVPMIGVGIAARDLSHVPFIPLRLTGTPIGRTEMLVGVRPFLVMTPRLLGLLESLGDFPHQTIPAHLVQDREDWRDHPPIDTTSFVVCNLHQHVRVIDFERSVLSPYEVEDGTRRIDRLVPVEGVTIPPLFRQDNWPLQPLIPRSTRDAILAAGMLDLTFLPPLEGGMVRLSDIHDPE